MKKVKKLAASLLSLCMLCALALPASAVNTNIQLSEFTGETIKCQVVLAHDDGTVSTETIDVSIPADATQSEEDSLVQNAILGTVFNSKSRSSARAIFDTIIEEDGIVIDYIYAQTDLGSGTLTNANGYKTLIGQFDFSSVTGTNYEEDGYPYLTVKFNDGNKTVTRGVTVSVGTNVLAVVTNGNLAMTNGTTISVSASVDIGRLTGDFKLLASETAYSY